MWTRCAICGGGGRARAGGRRVSAMDGDGALFVVFREGDGGTDGESDGGRWFFVSLDFFFVSLTSPSFCSVLVFLLSAVFFGT